MQSEAKKPGVPEVDAATVKGWLDTGKAVLIDVREPDEHARDRIPGAVLAPLSKFDPGTLPGESGRKLVFHCRHGRRSMDAATRAANAGHAEVFSLKGGIEGWKAAGLEIVENRAAAPISLMRQVQITIGILLLAGSALAYWGSPWFLVVPAFIGAGQMVAGMTGTCGLGVVLSLAPWNRAGAGATGAGHG